MKEVWKDIEGYAGLYQVSNLGRVKSLKRVVNRNDGRKNYVGERILKQKFTGQAKYPAVILSSQTIHRTCSIHRLVASAFLPLVEGKDQVNHIDGVKANNTVGNLEWCTKSENSKHAFDTGLNTPPPPLSGANNAASKAVLQYDINGNFIAEFECAREASVLTGVYQSGISRACCGKLKTAGGFVWKHK